MSLGTTSHGELVALAASFLRRRFRCCPVLAEASHYAEQPDAIGWQGSTHSHLIECKVSRSDFLRDRHKRARRSLGMGGSRWFLVPWGMVKVEECPPGWGLIYARDGRCRVQRKAKARPGRDYVWEIGALLSVLTLVERAQDGVPIHRNPRAERVTRNIGTVVWVREAARA